MKTFFAAFVVVLIPASMPAQELLKEAFERPPVTLDTFKQYALSTNPSLTEAKALIQESAGQARQAGLWPNPTVGYEGSEIRGGALRGGEQGGFVQQTIPLGGKLGLWRKVFEEQRRQDETGAAEQRIRVLSDVEQSYYRALAAQELVHVRGQLLDIAKDAIETAHQLANIGQADAPDVLQAEVEEEQAKAEYTTAQRTYIQDFRALSALAGKPDLRLAPVAGHLDKPPQLDPKRIVEEIITGSPSVKRAEQGVVMANAEWKSAKRERIPDLQIRAGLQQNFEPLNEVGGRPVGVQGFVTAGITLPLFNRNQGNVAAAEAERERAHSEVSRAKLSLRRQAEGLLQDYLSASEEANQYKNEMIPRAQRAYSLYLTKYRQMGAAYPEVLVSQRTLFQLRASYVAVLERVWSSAIALQNYTLAGGLGAPLPSGTTSTTLNLPGAPGGTAE